MMVLNIAVPVVIIRQHDHPIYGHTQKINSKERSMTVTVVNIEQQNLANQNNMKPPFTMVLNIAAVDVITRQQDQTI